MIASREPPKLFDRKAAILRLKRASRISPADFLLRQAANDLSDRLAPILRRFEVAADVGTILPHFANLVAALPGVETLIRVVTVAGSGGPGHQVVGDLEMLPLRREHFHLIVSGLALQGINDLPGALAQIRQALKPDGLFVACLAGGDTLKELRVCLTEAESQLTGGLSPRVFPFADIRDMGTLLQRAGFALPVTDSESLTVRYDTMFGLLQDLRAMGATNVLADRRRHATRRSVFVRAAEIYRDRFSDADGRIRATFEIIWVAGWAPHESQQKPLQPGTAKQSLAKALDDMRKA